ncbi:hypothetical protein [Streptomyces microflavus]|uniref:hypothetical protein n=1 Tax=Streptomyces microflavus TaxID=1919 RepID=UPI002E300BFE|nr:hypothetical protein [Streptomyces microflavus]
MTDTERELTDALHAIAKAAITVKPTLTTPYPDAPQWSPWTRWMEKPTRAGYNLAVLTRRRLGLGARPPEWQSTAATRLYDAAREQADQTVGHADHCEWHTNERSYCSCTLWPAACAGVDAAMEAMDTPAV